jgi:L-serine dehydratase
MVSLLDIIGPVMVGPSSSHTAGACRLGLLARALVGDTPQNARIELHGSFARTGEGHGTDKAIAGGLMGFRPDDERIRDALEIADRRVCAIRSRRRRSAKKTSCIRTAFASPSSGVTAAP